MAAGGSEGNRKASNRIRCTNNMKQIGLALHQFHDAHRIFPPASRRAASGTGRHSRRPHATCNSCSASGTGALAKQYDRNVNWYHEKNHPVITGHLTIVLCPSAVTYNRVSPHP